MTTLDQIRTYIQSESLFQPSQAVVAGVSGGPDSLCLMHALRQLGYQVVAAHFDHGIRPGGAGEAERIRASAEAAGCEFVSGTGDVPAEAAASGESLEAAAHLARYRFLVRVATEWKVNRIATGHTRDDQVETVLMNLLRGTGLAGLGGMRPLGPVGAWDEGHGPDAAIQLARPLLCLGRKDTLAYCREHDLHPIMDPSNDDRAYLRNRVRLELIPALETYNPSARRAVWRLAEVAQAASEWLEAQAQSAYGEAVREAGQDALALNEASFVALPVALQREVLRLVLEQRGTPLRESGYDAVERLRQAVTSGRPARLAMWGDGFMEQAGEEWLICGRGAVPSLPQFPLLASQTRESLSRAVHVRLDAGWELHVDRQSIGKRTPDSDREARPVEMTATFDIHGLASDLALRPPKPGDRLTPLGMDGSVKLSDLFINRKIPRRARGRWPVVVAGEEILWVAGLRQSRGHAVTASTTEVLRLELTRPQADPSLPAGKASVKEGTS